MRFPHSMLDLSGQAQRPASSPWPARLLLSAFLLTAGAWTTAWGGPIILETDGAVDPETEDMQTPYDAEEVLPIGLIQSPVTRDDVGAQHRSPFEGKEVMVQGVVHAEILLKRGDDGRAHGFYLQNTRDLADNDPDTSDALFVWTGREKTIDAELGPFAPRVGDELVLRGRVREVNGLTQLGTPRLVRLVRRDTDLDEVLTTFEVDPPDAPAGEADRFWERREGMRCTLPEGSMLTSGRKVFDRSAEAEVWVIHPKRAAALRAEPYHRRVFRDAHPLDDQPDTRYDNENSYRVRVGSVGLKGATGNVGIMLAPLRTFDVLTAPATGVAHQAYERYSVEVKAPLRIQRAVNPYANGRTTRPPTTTHFTVGTFNVENLYDLRNDPYDDYDFRDDPGGPSVRKPFNYVPSDLRTYRAKLRTLATQIVRGMQSPDIVMIQEIEDQDIGVADGDGLRLPGRDNADGLPDALQELVVAIRDAGGPAYLPANDRDGADVRGIVCAFLYNPQRVRLVRPDGEHRVLGRSLELDYRGVPTAFNHDVQNPKALNAVLPSDVDTSTGMSNTNVFSRAMQVALFEVFPGPEREDEALPLYILNNHFSSRPDQRVGQRKEQATMNAVLARYILDEQPGAYLVVGGDLNVYPRPDDPFEEPSDQLAALYQAGLWNLYDYLLEDHPASAYTYVYQGQAQTLDQLFLSPALRRRLERAWVPHVNSDWPAGMITDGRFGASDHEPVVAAFKF